MFHAARRAAPCLLFIDDFDVVSARRGTGDDGGAGGGDVAGRILSTFLNEIDGIHQVVSSNDEEKGEEDDRRVVVVVAAPSLQCLDEALLRPGRLQLHVELPCPSLEETVAFLDKRLSNVPGGKDIDTRELAGALHARSSSGTDAGVGSGKVSVGDVVHTVDKAVRNAIRRTIEQLKNNGGVALEGDDPLIGAALEARDFELLRNAPAPPLPSPSPFVFTPLN
jgi:SpoVK/Ycf46/Vps4 family AAA+-type ATPase